MFNNSFANLQKVGKSLMLPVSVLPIAGILLGIGSANLHFIPLIISHIMAEAGSSVFTNMPLIFAIGVALGFTKNDGVSALASVVSYGIMTHTLSVVAPMILHIDAITIDKQHLCDTGIVGGIIVGIVSSYLFNICHHIQLPEYLGFFTGKRFVPIASGLASIILGIVLAFIWPPIGHMIKSFSSWAAYQNPLLAFGIYGIVERMLVPLGLHHIWNVPFQMQIGEYTNSIGQVFHGDIARYMAGDPTAGRLSGGFLFKMYGLPGAALAIWKCAKKTNQKKIGGIMISASLTAFLTGITEPIEFSFILVAPVLYVIHSILSGLAFTICAFLDMKAGTSFSHGLIDFIILSGNSNKIWLFPIIGFMYTLTYYLIFYILIKKFNLNTPGREKIISNKFKNNDEIALNLITILGKKNNISNLDACITRLRISVVEISKVNKNELNMIGASGIIISGTGIQIVFGTKSDKIKNLMEKYMNN
ncbi:PTS system glucose-specific EIICB component [Buchnera aphidicola (Eriosoma grossulariae)]|uniref:PTS glucose transporter subunit IIBC n=1 Tax=Buchnera aphidicola TaxID=9 RepID=UPI0034647EDA